MPESAPKSAGKSVIFCRSNPVAPDPRVEKAAATLASAGYSVRVIAWDRTGTVPREGTLNQGVPIIRISIQAAYATGSRNLVAGLSWQWKLLRQLLKRRKTFIIIHACDFDTVAPSLIMKWLFNKKVVYDIFDFYAEHIRGTPASIKTLIRLLDHYAINRADAIILADESRKEQIRGTNPRHIEVIYNTPDEPKIKLEESHDKGAFSIAYVGLLQLERGLLELLQVMERHAEWKLTLAGFGGDEERLQKAAANLPNVSWLGRISYEEALHVSAAADALIATYDPRIPNHKYSSPNKLFEAMMLAKPIIVARGTNMDAIVEQWNMGLVVDYGDVAALEAAISTLAGDAELRKTLGQNARRAYDRDYNWDSMRKRLLNLYAQVSGGQV